MSNSRHKTIWTITWFWQIIRNGNSLHTYTHQAKVQVKKKKLEKAFCDHIGFLSATFLAFVPKEMKERIEGRPLPLYKDIKTKTENTFGNTNVPKSTTLSVNCTLSSRPTLIIELLSHAHRPDILKSFARSSHSEWPAMWPTATRSSTQVHTSWGCWVESWKVKRHQKSFSQSGLFLHFFIPVKI